MNPIIAERQAFLAPDRSRRDRMAFGQVGAISDFHRDVPLWSSG
jgi:hypothetical protein